MEQIFQYLYRKEVKMHVIHKLKINRIFLFGVLVGLLSACSSARVNTDVDPKANLSNYRTFKFTDGENKAGDNPLYRSSLVDNSIHAEIAIQLEKRGINEDVTNPDMFVAYHTYTEKKQSSSNSYYPMMYGGWGWRFYPWGYAPYPYNYWDGYQRTYTEGTLIIDAIDAKTNQVVWRGSISDAIDDPANLHRKAVKAVEIIFKKFPVKSIDSSLKLNDSQPAASKK
jgi:hypothetical protein